jgi:hypothetical protein
LAAPVKWMAIMASSKKIRTAKGKAHVWAIRLWNRWWYFVLCMETEMFSILFCINVWTYMYSVNLYDWCTHLVRLACTINQIPLHCNAWWN